MKKVLVTISLIMTCGIAISQQDTLPANTEVSLDLLRAPVSPAANLLGISSSQVEKPTDPAAFMTSIQTATGNLTAIPTSYAVDLAPAWLFCGPKITLDDYLSPKVGKTMAQSFVVSIATNTVQGTTDTMPDVTQLAAGVKFSIFRGTVSQESKGQLDELGTILGELAEGFQEGLDSLKASDPKYHYLDSLTLSILLNPNLTFEEKQAMTKPLRTRMVSMEDSMETYLRTLLINDFERARKAAEELRINRYGFKLDISAALAWGFPDMSFDQGRLNTIAAWATGGYECPCGFSILAIARYLYFDGAPFADSQDLILYRNYSAMDGGLRLIYSNPASRFSTSIEAIYRTSVDYAEVDPSWRITANAEYEVGRNKKLALILGRDFDGTFTGDGNVIVALNLLLGFGTNKKL